MKLTRPQVNLLRDEFVVRDGSRRTCPMDVLGKGPTLRALSLKGAVRIKRTVRGHEVELTDEGWAALRTSVTWLIGD